LDDQRGYTQKGCLDPMFKIAGEFFASKAMNTIFAKLTGAEFDAMVDRGVFDCIQGKKAELIRGELRFMNPSAPIHDDYIDYLTRWSYNSTTREIANIRVQCGFICDDNRPEPDILWLQPRRYGRTRPTARDVMLLIEVSDSSLSSDLQEKANIYAEAGVQEVWVVDIPSSRIHVLSKSDGNSYRKIEIAVAPQFFSPTCLIGAKLDLSDLFSVT
jgi:Uma2 family endonuclease